MKITFLGTSHGYPEQGRRLSCTMLEIGGALYFIDVGAPLAQLTADRGFNKERIRALFVTHRHSDHLGGAYAFLISANEYWTNISLDVVLPDQRAISQVQQMILAESPSYDEKRIRFLDLNRCPTYSDENLKLTAIPNRHTNGLMRSYSFYIEAEGKKLLFTGDLHANLEDFPAVAFGAEPLDLIVCEYAHSSHAVMDATVGKLRTRQLLFNHIYPEKEKLPQIEVWNSVYPFPIRAVADDDEIEI